MWTLLTVRCVLQCALQLKEDGNGNVKILSSNAGKEFAAEEISAQVLRKLVDDAGKFLNDKVAHQYMHNSLIGCAQSMPMRSPGSCSQTRAATYQQQLRGTLQASLPKGSSQAQMSSPDREGNQYYSRALTQAV